MWNPQVGAGAGPADAGAACEEGKEAAWVESEKYGGHDRFRGGGCVRRREGAQLLQCGPEPQRCKNTKSTQQITL